MNMSEADGIPRTQPAFSGRPPRPPKITARGLYDQPDEPGPKVFISDPVIVTELARLLNVKPFKLVATLIRMKIFVQANEAIEFKTASAVVREYGFEAERLLPDSF